MADMLKIVLLFVVIGVSVVYSKSVLKNNEDPKEWLFTEGYSKNESKAFAGGNFHLGVPKGHSCHNSFTINGGRFICAVNLKDTVMCLAQCMEGHKLEPGYKDNIETEENKLTNFGVYRCRPQDRYWTDINGVKLNEFSPYCKKFK